MNRKKAFISVLAWAAFAAWLHPQSISVTSPNGGESWTIGSTATVLWSSSGVATVRLILYRGGTASTNRVGIIAEGLSAASGSYTWTAGSYVGGSAAAGGDYYIRVKSEADATDDVSAAPFALVSTLPNIRIGSMREIGWDHTFVPAAFTAGDTVTIHYRLTNDGPSPAGAFSVGLRVGGTIVARNAHAALDNGGEGSGQFAWTAVCGQPIAVVADCDGAVAEGNEGDNVLTDPGLACSQPDLKFFSDLRCSSGGDTAKAGLPYTFSAQVDSEGARADNVRVVGGVIGGAVLYDHTFPSMAADGGIERAEFIWEVPEGAQRLYMEIDPDHAVAESNERNNRQEIAVTGVVSTPATETYDLSVRIDRARSFGSRLGPIEVPAGRPLTVYGEVRGATGAIRDFTVTGSVRTPRGMSKIFSQDFRDPSSLAIPFSFSWTPGEPGENTLSVHASLGPHAVAVGVVDRVPANNTATITVRVTKAAAPLLRKR